MSGVLFSVVIATKDRAIYCIETIKTILAVLEPDSELVVHDNSESAELSDFAAGIDDPRFVYRFNNNREPLSFVANFNKAMSLSRGEYVCALGDDDSITKDIYQVIRWMRENSVESVAPKQNVSYIWPDSRNEKYKHGEITVPLFSGQKLKIDVQTTLVRLLEDGIINYQQYGLPRVYHGIVKRIHMEAIYKETGHFFGGLTQDIYSTVALSCVVRHHYVIDFPFTIAGACPASFSVANLQGNHAGELAEAPHMVNRGAYSWEKCIPAYYSVETIWAETALKALKEMRREDLYKRFNKFNFLVWATIINKRTILKLSVRKAITLYKPLGINPVGYWVLLGWYAVSIIGKHAFKKIFNSKVKAGPSGITKTGVHSLDEAITITETELARQKAIF